MACLFRTCSGLTAGAADHDLPPDDGDRRAPFVVICSLSCRVMARPWLITMPTLAGGGDVAVSWWMVKERRGVVDLPTTGGSEAVLDGCVTVAVLSIRFLKCTGTGLPSARDPESLKPPEAAAL